MLYKLLERTEKLREDVRSAYNHAENYENTTPLHDALWHALNHAEDLHHWLQEAINA